MKITGGQIKGRILAAPKNLDIRPSSNKVRAAIFNIIGQELSGTRVLDLFSGTGILGIEALSRGAALGVFVDYAKQSMALMRKNLLLCGYEHKGSICKWDLARGLPKNRAFLDTTYDLVFLDPPYGSHLVAGLIEKLARSERLASGALIVLETGKDSTIRPCSPLILVETRTYGDTKISIFKKEDLS